MLVLGANQFNDFFFIPADNQADTAETQTLCVVGICNYFALSSTLIIVSPIDTALKTSVSLISLALPPCFLTGTERALRDFTYIISDLFLNYNSPVDCNCGEYSKTPPSFDLKAKKMIHMFDMIERCFFTSNIVTVPWTLHICFH